MALSEVSIARFLRRREVERITGLSCSTIYDLMSRDEFPKPVPLQGNRVAWVSTEIIEWQKARIAARDKLAKVAAS